MATRTVPNPKTAETLDLSELLSVLMAYKVGDFSVRMRPDKTGLAGKVADILNEVIQQNQ